MAQKTPHGFHSKRSNGARRVSSTAGTKQLSAHTMEISCFWLANTNRNKTLPRGLGASRPELAAAPTQRNHSGKNNSSLHNAYCGFIALVRHRIMPTLCDPCHAPSLFGNRQPESFVYRLFCPKLIVHGTHTCYISPFCQDPAALLQMRPNIPYTEHTLITSNTTVHCTLLPQSAANKKQRRHTSSWPAHCTRDPTIRSPFRNTIHLAQFRLMSGWSFLPSGVGACHIL